MSDEQLCTACPRPATDMLCPGCFQRLERQLGQLPALLAELAVTRTGRDRISRGGRSGKGHSAPLPIRTAMMELEQGIHTTLAAWVRAVSGHDAPPATSSAAMACWLHDQVQWARTSPDAAQLADEVQDMTDQILRAIDRPPTRFYAGPCGAWIGDFPFCLELNGVIVTQTVAIRCTLALYGRDGKDDLVCDGYRQPDAQTGRRTEDEDGEHWKVGCGHTSSWKGREAHLADGLVEAWLPLNVIIDAMAGPLKMWTPPAATLRTWRRREQLTPVGLTDNAVELYRGGDVMSLCEQALANPRVPGSGRKAKEAAA